LSMVMCAVRWLINAGLTIDDYPHRLHRHRMGLQAQYVR
jgi:hypothetical protein